jgi:sigma-B regulation protein RsbU (phosphoserine phosphatase)
MKRNVNSIQQAGLVRQMSCRLEHASPRGGFASTLVSTYFAPTRYFTLCNAGHPPPLLFRVEAGEWSILKQQPAETPSNDALFGVVDPSEYQQFKTKLQVGDMVLSYSNTLTECRSAEGCTIGLDGILDRVRHMDSDAPSHLPAALIEQIHGEHADNLVTDDATLLLCQANETPVAWRDNVLAPFRLLRSVSDKTKIV